MNPYCFRLPASPHLAAEEEGVRIEKEKIVRACTKLAGPWDALVVEGAGGLLVPLTRNVSTLDLAVELGLPLIVVARAGLGTINHSLLTVQAARQAGLKVAALVLNHAEPENSLSVDDKKIEEDNRRIIQKLGRIPVVLVLPYIPGAGRIKTANIKFAEIIARKWKIKL